MAVDTEIPPAMVNPAILPLIKADSSPSEVLVLFNSSDSFGLVLDLLWIS